MPRGTWSRLLLCLLMLWQLGASVLAHPIDGLQAAAAPAVETPCHEHDMHEHDMDAMSDHHRSAGETAAPDAERQQAPAHDGCKSTCKCACANTPALSFVLPQNVPVAPSLRILPQPLHSIDALSPGRLLRPPI